MTVASGRGLAVAEVGRNIPAAVFYTGSMLEAQKNQKTKPHCFWLEALDEDAIQQRYYGLDGFECCLGSL